MMTFFDDQAAWHKTLVSMQDALPQTLAFGDIWALGRLPIFAMTLVVHQDALTQDPNALLEEWCKTQTHFPRFYIVPVEGAFDTPLSGCEQDTLSSVCVFRYILTTSPKETINAAMTPAAAHLIDEQITAYVRRKLRPMPNFDYTIDKDGKVQGFDPAARQKQTFVDCHILPISHVLRRYKLACFDMDSTLIAQEVIEEVARFAGCFDEVQAITEQAMRGEIDFATSFTRRLALLEGLDASCLPQIAKRLTPSPGARAVICALKAMGVRCVLISGGFTYFAKHIAQLLEMDDYHANGLDIESGKLTGKVQLPILDKHAKAVILAKIADEMTIDLEEVLAVGDGANDLEMMAVSGLSVAYHAKPIVRIKAHCAVNVTGLEGVLYAMGLMQTPPNACDKGANEV